MNLTMSLCPCSHCQHRRSVGPPPYCPRCGITIPGAMREEPGSEWADDVCAACDVHLRAEPPASRYPKKGDK